MYPARMGLVKSNEWQYSQNVIYQVFDIFYNTMITIIIYKMGYYNIMFLPSLE